MVQLVEAGCGLMMLIEAHEPASFSLIVNLGKHKNKVLI
jgi:hypothetical protein